MKREEITVFLKEEVAGIVEKEPQAIDDNINFMKLGVSSVQSLKIINKLRKRLGIDINPVAMFEYKTIGEFAEYLAGQ